MEPLSCTRISGQIVRRQNLLDKLAMDLREDLVHQSFISRFV
jgi:hypothetical protein